MVNVYFFAVFQQPWGQGSRCQGGSSPTLRPRGGFPHEFNSSQHRTKRGKGVGSSTTVTVPKTFEFMFPGGGISCGGDGTGVTNAIIG